MATGSFGREFRVDENKVDEFTETVLDDSVVYNLKTTEINSKLMTGEDMRRYCHVFLKNA